jgi:hypothetical protein
MGTSPAKALLHTAAIQNFRSVTLLLFFNNDQLHQYGISTASQFSEINELII